MTNKEWYDKWLADNRILAKYVGHPKYGTIISICLEGVIYLPFIYLDKPIIIERIYTKV